MDSDASSTSAVACGPDVCAASTPRGFRDGRARASATAAIRRQRSARSRICRSRSRRAFWRCERRTNSMAPKASGLGRRWLKRCTRIGSAIASSPHRYAGWTNCSTSAPPRNCGASRRLPAREQLQEDAVGRGVGRDLLHLDVGASQVPARALQEAPDLLQVALADLPRLRLDLALVLHGEEPGRVVEGKLQLLAIVGLQEKDVVPAGAEYLQGGDTPIGGVEQIGEHDHQRAPAGLLRREVERGRQQRGPAALRALQGVQQLLHVAGRGSEGQVLPHSWRDAPVAGEEEAHLIALPREQVGEGASAYGRVLQLGHRPPPVRHAAAGVEHQERTQIRLHLEALDVVLVELGEGAPVDVPDLVARRVLLVLLEFDRLAVVGTLVQPGQDAFHHLARLDLQGPEAGQHRGNVRRREPHALVSRSSSAITRRESTPSASAWKFVITRWRRTGSTSARTSWTSAAGRPCSAARAFAARISAWDARGPAPQLTWSFTCLPASSCGRVRRTSSTAWRMTCSAAGTRRINS